MKKRQIANMTMVLLIVLMAVAGVLGVGYVRGWFDRADSESAVLTDIRGIVTMERGGAAYPVSAQTVLRRGDRISCGSGATAVIRVGESALTLGEQVQLEINGASAWQFQAKVAQGQIFADVSGAVTVSFDDRTVQLADTVALLSVRGGAQSISIFSGSVGEATAGQVLEWVGAEAAVSTLTIRSLNDFCIAQLRQVNETRVLFFSDAELDQLISHRQQALEELLNGQTKPTQPSEETTAPTAPSQTEPGETDPPETAPPTTVPPEISYDRSCTITIRCETVLDNMDQLDPAKAGAIPGDGVILQPIRVGFNDGETVFDILRRVCQTADIQLEYSMNPLYGSYYIEGINNLYEFDCGFSSGWMYQVNGWFPDQGCSDFFLSEGDVITWCYTCQGLGADLGAPQE